jgi:hypothetical protein
MAICNEYPMVTCDEHESMGTGWAQSPFGAAQEEDDLRWAVPVEDDEITDQTSDRSDLGWEEEAILVFGRVAEDRTEKTKTFLVVVYERLGILIRELKASRLRNQGHLTPGDTSTLEEDKFLTDVYRLSSENKVHAAGDLIFDFVQEFLRNGNFQDCQRLLMAVDVSRLEPALLVTFLSTTFEARHKLQPSRDEYFEKVSRVLARTRGTEATSQLLNKYR